MRRVTVYACACIARAFPAFAALDEPTYRPTSFETLTSERTEKSTFSLDQPFLDSSLWASRLADAIRADVETERKEEPPRKQANDHQLSTHIDDMFEAPSQNKTPRSPKKHRLSKKKIAALRLGLILVLIFGIQLVINLRALYATSKSCHEEQTGQDGSSKTGDGGQSTVHDDRGVGGGLAPHAGEKSGPQSSVYAKERKRLDALIDYLGKMSEQNRIKVLADQRESGAETEKPADTPVPLWMEESPFLRRLHMSEIGKSDSNLQSPVSVDVRHAMEIQTFPAAVAVASLRETGQQSTALKMVKYELRRAAEAAKQYQFDSIEEHCKAEAAEKFLARLGDRLARTFQVRYAKAICREESNADSGVESQDYYFKPIEQYAPTHEYLNLRWTRVLAVTADAVILEVHHVSNPHGENEKRLKELYHDTAAYTIGLRSDDSDDEPDSHGQSQTSNESAPPPFHFPMAMKIPISKLSKDFDSETLRETANEQKLSIQAEIEAAQALLSWEIETKSEGKGGTEGAADVEEKLRKLFDVQEEFGVVLPQYQGFISVPRPEVRVVKSDETFMLGDEVLFSTVPVSNLKQTINRLRSLNTVLSPKTKEYIAHRLIRIGTRLNNKNVNFKSFGLDKILISAVGTPHVSDICSTPDHSDVSERNDSDGDNADSPDTIDAEINNELRMIDMNARKMKLLSQFHSTDLDVKFDLDAVEEDETFLKEDAFALGRALYSLFTNGEEPHVYPGSSETEFSVNPNPFYPDQRDTGRNEFQKSNHPVAQRLRQFDTSESWIKITSALLISEPSFRPTIPQVAEYYSSLFSSPCAPQ